MGFLDWLLGKPGESNSAKQSNGTDISITPASIPPVSVTPTSMVTDLRKAECPSCHETLKKIPGAKTKCPHCGQYMYVRTRLKDRARIVVTEDEAEKIKEEWAIVGGAHAEYLAQKKEIENEREVLKHRFGQEPSDNDVMWGVLTKRQLEAALYKKWGLYRSTRFEMAEILRKEKRYKGALDNYLEVCFIDMNGIENKLDIDSDEMRTYQVFNPDSGYLAPGILSRVAKMAENAGLEKSELKQKVLENYKKLKDNFKFPLSPESCWGKLEHGIR